MRPLRSSLSRSPRTASIERDRLHWRHHSSLPQRLLTSGQIEIVAPFQDLCVEAGLEQAAAGNGNRAGVPHLEAIASARVQK